MAISRSISDAVVVITGASSGIGAATALALAEMGTTVVLAGRGSRGLDPVVRRCRTLGGEAVGVPADVTEPAAMEQLAERAVEEFGRVDGWVNNAGIATVGPFEHLPPEEFRRVIEVNLLGVVHGTRAALPRLRAAGGGVVVNNASLLAEISMPYQSAYNAAKHGVLGFSETLRQELRVAGERDISICTVLPPTIDTPFFRHAANHSGRRLVPPRPVHSPEAVAQAIVALLCQPRRTAYPGFGSGLIGLHWRLLPGWSERLLAWYGHRAQFAFEPAATSAGNLFHSMSTGTTSGGWRGRPRRALRISAALALAVAGTVAGALGTRARRIPDQ